MTVTNSRAVWRLANVLSESGERWDPSIVQDRKGRSVRKYYAARVREYGPQVMKWDDWNAPRPLMEDESANRRNQILYECRQLKTDVDSYSDRLCPTEPIQIDFNFNVDLEELDQLGAAG